MFVNPGPFNRKVLRSKGHHVHPVKRKPGPLQRDAATSFQMGRWGGVPLSLDRLQF